MDNQFNNFYVQQPSPKKKWGFGHGFGFGILTGGILLLVALGIILMLYSRFSSQHVVIGDHGAQTVQMTDILDEETVERLDELTEYMDVYFYEGYDTDVVQDSLCKGLIDGLGDPYSVYYTEEEYEEMQIDTTGEYYGIGAGLTQDPNTMEVTVNKIYSGTPSEEAGLKEKDIILYVDDIEATSMELTELVQNIRGEEGTSVFIQVYRPSTDKILEFDVERRNVELPSVEGKMLSNNIGYIEILEFQTNTATQFKTLLEELESQDMEGLIVDVRANPGGTVNSVVSILDILLPEGIVMYMEDKYGDRDNFYSDSSCVDYPIVVLMDENSASASEIFAGAIKDYNYGTLVGKTTFGKGIVQSVFPIDDGGALKITTARYFTPNGSYIHGVGIEPDIEIDYEYSGPEDEEYDMQYDSQVQKAIEVMNEELSK